MSVDDRIDPNHIHPQDPPSALNVLSNAHDFSANELRFVQAHTIQKTKYVIYNSGGQLIELSRLLNPIGDASHKRNRGVSPPDSQCLPGTRHGVFKEIRSWVKNEMSSTPEMTGNSQNKPTSAGRPMCWLYGFVGCGKSAIAQNIAEEFAGKGRLAISFFFFRNAGERSAIHRFAATLAHQISLNVPGAKVLIEQAIVNEPWLVDPTCSLKSQLESLVYGPLLAALTEGGISTGDPYLMVVDGLDECMDKEGISTFIDASIEFFSHNPTIPLRLLITSRIEEHIQTHIEAATQAIHLIDLVSRSSRADVASLMTAEFATARKYNRALRALGDEWPDQRDMDQLVEYCDGSFIFGSTLARFILKGSGGGDTRTPMERLPLALKINPGLDGVYIEVLSRAAGLPHFHTIVSTIACAQTPISITAMAALLGLTAYDVIRVLTVLQAVLQVPGRDDVPVTVFHTSLRDFLVDESRSGVFHSPPSHHAYIMNRCLDLLFGVNPSASPECCKYAMMYWPVHLEIATKLDGDFDSKSATDDVFSALDTDGATKADFKTRWAQRRPLNLVLSEGDWANMMRNYRKTDATIRGRGVVDEVDEIPGQYYEDQADKSQWLLARTEGYGRRYRPIVRVDSSHACSIKDILQGFCTLMSAVNNQSWKLHFAIRRSEDISVNIEFNRTGVASTEDERYQIPGGSRITISSDLSVGLYNFITRP